MIGDVVGNYRVLEKIGEGGMGAVFKGVDMMLEREVAIKALRPELARQPNIVERFRAEAVTLAKLNHPNIAMLHSFFRQGDDFFMVMEYVKGETLDSVIRGRGALLPDRAVFLFCQALDGIHHAHQLGIIHRDLKPANIMLTDSGSIKVMDFGIARVLGTARMTREGHLIGTIEYMSPEQIRGKETDARSDIYSLGILLYEMLTGRVPFTSPSEYELMRMQIEAAPPPPRDLAPHVSLPVEEVIMRSLAKRPEARFQAAGEFRIALLNCMRAATNPDAHAPLFSAPLTRMSGPIAAPVSQATAGIKETRLPDAAIGGGYVAAGGVAEPTRIAAIVPAEIGQPGRAVQKSRSGNIPFLNRLNWKHYIVGAIGLFIVVSISFALIIALSTGGGQAEGPVQPDPAAGDSAPAIQVRPPSQDVNHGQVTPVEGRDGNRNGRNRNGGDDRSLPQGSDGTTPGDSANPVEVKPKDPAKDTTTKETPPKDSSAKTGDKKEEAKDDSKVKKIGGFFKKLIKREEEEKKDKKKP